MVELEDLVARRDYRLIPLLKKTCICGRSLGLLQTVSTIKQMCNDNYCRKIYPIIKECSYCHTVYDYDDVECWVCDAELTKLTEAEITIEDNQRLIRRSKRKMKENKLTEKEYNDIVIKAQAWIKICEERARKIKEKRQIG